MARTAVVEIGSCSPKTSLIAHAKTSSPTDGLPTRSVSRRIYVLWLLQWTPALDAGRYAPKLWEKWIHAAYYGRVYYWIEGLTVASYRFDPHFKSVPRKTWYAEGGKKMTGGGYSRRSKRYRTPVRERTLNLATDFGPKQRYWWQGNGIRVPDAKLFMDRNGSPQVDLEYD